MVQVKLLSQSFFGGELQKLGFSVVTFSEPSESEWGKQLRRISKNRRLSPKKEFELFLKDRQEDVNKNILPALKKRNIVIMDRYYYSHVYQAARGMDLKYMIRENEKFAPKPDLIIILDLPVEVALKRLTKNRKYLDKFEKKEYLNKVRNLYLNLGSKLQNAYIIDANKNPDEIVNTIMEIILTTRGGNTNESKK